MIVIVVNATDCTKNPERNLVGLTAIIVIASVKVFHVMINVIMVTATLIIPKNPDRDVVVVTATNYN